MATKKVVEPPKKEHPQKAITNILMRIVAVFAASGLSVLGAGAVVGIDTVQAVFLAGLLGVATVVMTCIVALRHEDKIYMAGDRGASDDGVILSLESPKVWKVGPYLIGYAGSMDGDRIRHNFRPSAPNIKDTDKFMHTKFIKELREFYNEFWIDTSKEGELSLIIGIRGEIYEHSSGDMSLSKYSLPYVSIGSGSEYAYGVLYATDKQKNARNRVNQAVSAAIKFNPSCMGPVDIISA